MQYQGCDITLQQAGDFALYDLINDSNLDQFINLIRGENEDPVAPTFDGGLVFDSGIIDDLFDPAPEDDILHFNSLPSFSGDIDVLNQDNDGEDDSSGTTATPTKSTKGDRTRTLASERRRRSRTKEKLYALRSLVPNITKMDKASIVGDAVSYVQELQMQAKKIKAEIAGLEASLINAAEKYPCTVPNPKSTNNVLTLHKQQSSSKKILKTMDVFQVEEKEYYGRVVCNKGEGVAVALHKALESLLLSFHLKSSNLSTNSERFVFTFAVDVKESWEEMNVSTLKLWATGAFLNQGFQMEAL